MDPKPPNRFHRIGRALRMVRERRGLTQEKVAKRAKIGRSRVSGWETERHPPTLESLGILVQAIGCDLAELDHALAIAQQRPTRPLPPLPAKPPVRQQHFPIASPEELTRWALGVPTRRVPGTAEMELLPHAEAFLSLASHLREQDERRRAAVLADEELPTF